MTRPAVPAVPALVALALASGCVADVPSAELGDVGAATAELRVCPDSTTVRGIDISHHQGTIDWDAVAAAGTQFAFIRVSDGTTTMDREFHRNWQEAGRVGIIRGVYQYFRPSQDPIAQADLLLRELGALGAGNLPPVIDVEETSGRSPGQVADAVRTWIDHVEDAVGRRPIIYTARYFWQDDVGNADLRDYPLWIANWGVSCPDLPSAWSGWSFWQTTETGRVTGISGNVDLDEFNGTLEELRAFARSGCTPGCEGDVFVGADCSRSDCAAFGSRCVDDAVGARCVFESCPAGSDVDLCVSDTVIGHCIDGGVVPDDCGGYAGLCSTAGREPTEARCVSAFCVGGPDEVPVAHGECWDALTVMHCNAEGEPTFEECPGGSACSAAGGVAHCAPVSCPETGEVMVCVDGRYLGTCRGGAVMTAEDCGDGRCSEEGGAHCTGAIDRDLDVGCAASHVPRARGGLGIGLLAILVLALRRRRRAS